jgi:predicted RNA-binding Zn ribbon-like protein
MPMGPDGQFIFEYVGGRTCLDFTNTVGGMRGVNPGEYLLAYPDLVRWAVGAGLVSEAHAERLRAAAERDPAAAERALARAREVREAIYRVLLAVPHGELPPAQDVALLNEELGAALAHQRLVRRGEGWALGWPEDGAELEAPLWPIVKSAAELLADPAALPRVHRCAGDEDDDCSWLFLDETRSGTRRWCSMADCGNRAKARRHYERVRRAGARR